MNVLLDVIDNFVNSDRLRIEVVVDKKNGLLNMTKNNGVIANASTDIDGDAASQIAKYQIQ